MATRHLNWAEALMGLTLRKSIRSVLLSPQERALHALEGGARLTDPEGQLTVRSLVTVGWCPSCGAATFGLADYGARPGPDRCLPKCDLREDDANVGAFLDAGLRALGGS